MAALSDNSTNASLDNLSNLTAGGVVVDIGTGDGRFVYLCARENPTKFYIGIDANAKPLEKISMKATRKPAKVAEDVAALTNLLGAPAAGELWPGSCVFDRRGAKIDFEQMKIAVAMSGGVDSSAAAAILKEQGHELVGFTMQLWNQRRGLSVDENGEPLPSRCCSLDDVYDARRVAEELGFPFYVLNLEREFEQDVVQPFIASYLNGETPIPCVACNSRLKFASLDRLASSLGCEKVATGHYARVDYDAATNRYRLRRGRDPQKDQSYFLWELTQDQLSRSLFPLGEMSKAEARESARHNGLAVSEKAESQEICFVPDGDYAGFIDRYLDSEDELERLPGKGEIVSARGEVIGEHAGIHHYTIGQRRGIGIAGAQPLYVIGIDSARNRVVVGNQDELSSAEFTAAGVNWIALDNPSELLRAEVRVRYRHTAAPATITLLPDDRVHVEFDEPQRAITPGQATVFYRGDEVVGGGWIFK